MTQPDEELIMLDDRLDPETRDLEAPDADAQEQAIPADPASAADLPAQPQVPLEADEADVVEQAQVVELDEDYR